MRYHPLVCSLEIFSASFWPGLDAHGLSLSEMLAGVNINIIDHVPADKCAAVCICEGSHYDH